MKDISMVKGTFTIASIAKSATGTGHVLLHGSMGILTGVRISVAGSATDVDLYLGDGVIASTTSSNILYAKTTINGGARDYEISRLFYVSDKKLHYRVVNNDGANATGAITINIDYEALWGIVDDGTLTVTAT